MDRFLASSKQRARDRSIRWKLVPWGSREQAYRRFRAAVREKEADIVVLLVDAEGPVTTSRISHLAERDGWNLDFTDTNAVHLMVQSMETWIVADVEALQSYYGSGFRRRALPSTTDLESVERSAIGAALQRATRDTRKRTYHKIRDGSNLLGRINPEIVQGKCPSSARLFDAINSFIELN